MPKTELSPRRKIIRRAMLLALFVSYIGIEFGARYLNDRGMWLEFTGDAAVLHYADFSKPYSWCRWTFSCDDRQLNMMKPHQQKARTDAEI